MEHATVCASGGIAVAYCNARSRSDEENEANAQLIAAAPELQAAVTNFMSLVIRAQEILTAYSHPDASGDADEAIGSLLELLDGPRQREVFQQALAIKQAA